MLLSRCCGPRLAVSSTTPIRGFTVNSSYARQQRALRGPFRICCVATVGPEVQASVDEDGSLYEVFGVAPTASVKEIRQAYYKLLKAYHPDVNACDEAHDFAAFLNDCYETLIDDERRKDYDAIAGFSLDGINPFEDTSYPLDNVFVDEFTCIGCKACVGVCPKTFQIENDYGRARVMMQQVDTDDKLDEAIDTCPVNCIKRVSSPQLACLEVAMSRMEKIQSFLLMTGGGGHANVFFEARLQWEKRQQSIRARLSRQQTLWSWGSWGPSNSSSSGQVRQEPSTKSSRHAANIAAAARKWRDFQRTRKVKLAGMLTSERAN